MLTLLVSLPALADEQKLISTTKALNQFLEKPTVDALCTDPQMGSDEKWVDNNSEIKIMYPCSAIEDDPTNKIKRGTVLEGLTDKKKVYPKSDGTFYSDDEVNKMDDAQKSSIEQRKSVEVSAIQFFKLTPLIDKNDDGKNDLVLRARDNSTTGEKDFTIKIRPMEPETLQEGKLDPKSMKCERDVAFIDKDFKEKTDNEKIVGDRTNISCSQTIDNVLLPSEDSKKFLELNQFNVASMVPYPAITSTNRTLKASLLDFPADYLKNPEGTPMLDAKGKQLKVKVSLERWQVPEAIYPEGCFLELSAKVPLSYMSRAGSKLKQSFEKALQIEFDATIEQGNKTGQALKLIEKLDSK